MASCPGTAAVLLFSAEWRGPRQAWAAWQAADVPLCVPLDLGGGLRRPHRPLRLDEAMRHADAPMIAVTAGEACLALAFWAQLTPASYFRHLTGALLLHPAEPSGTARDLARAPRTRLRFPSAVIARDDLAAAAWAQRWGSVLVQDCASNTPAWTFLKPAFASGKANFSRHLPSAR